MNVSPYAVFVDPELGLDPGATAKDYLRDRRLDHFTVHCERPPAPYDEGALYAVARPYYGLLPEEVLQVVEYDDSTGSTIALEVISSIGPNPKGQLHVFAQIWFEKLVARGIFRRTEV